MSSSVWQALKNARALSELEQRQSRRAFAIVTKNGSEMSASQLRQCLRALGFPSVTKEEAEALVYEFDYSGSERIDLKDFQRIYLFKVSGSSDGTSTRGLTWMISTDI